MRKREELRVALLRLAFIALISSCIQMARAQTPDPDETRARQPADYFFPSVRQRIHDSVRDTFGPGALLQSTLIAGAHHFANDPPEWRHGTEGFSRRLASRIGGMAIQNGIELGLGTALQQDLGYRRCNCHGILRRTGHAFISNFTAYTRDGRTTFTPAKAASRYAGAMISTAWYPDRYTAGGDGVRIGTLSMASGTVLNILREFWPDIRRFFGR